MRLRGLGRLVVVWMGVVGLAGNGLGFGQASRKRVTAGAMVAGQAVAAKGSVGEACAGAGRAGTGRAGTRGARQCAVLYRKIAAMISEPAVTRAHWGVMVQPVDGDGTSGGKANEGFTFALNGGQYFQPASNAKLFTTAAAIALLGESTTFETKVVARGVFPESSRLKGNLVLVGGGEANLSGRPLPYRSPKELQSQREKDGSRDGVSGTVKEGQISEPPPPKPAALRYLEQMADEVAATGLKVIDGDVVGDDTLFPWEPYPNDWAIDDAVWGYGAPVSALTINDNQMEVTVRPGPEPGFRNGSVSVDPALPAYYTVDASQLVTGAPAVGDAVQMERAPGSKVLRVYGGLGAGTAPDVAQVAIQDPAEFGAMALKAMLEARGIRVTGVARAEHWIRSLSMGFLQASKEMGEVQAKGLSEGRRVCEAGVSRGVAGAGEERVLARHQSGPFEEDIVLTNKVSQNLHAELLLHQLGLKVACEGSTSDGAGVVRGFLIGMVGIDPEDFVFYDGSGLSGHDLVTPRATVQLLTWARTQPWFASWKASLPVGGEDGSLATRFGKGPLKGKVFAKTGTLGEARALSGYLEGASGRTVAFSVMVTDHAPGGHADQEVMDRIVEAIAAAN